MEGNEQEPRQNDTKTIYHDDYTCRLKIQTTETWIQAFPHCLLHLAPGCHLATLLLRLGPHTFSDMNGFEQQLFLSVWFILLSLMSYKFIHIIANGMISFIKA